MPFTYSRIDKKNGDGKSRFSLSLANRDNVEIPVKCDENSIANANEVKPDPFDLLLLTDKSEDQEVSRVALKSEIFSFEINPVKRPSSTYIKTVNASKKLRLNEEDSKGNRQQYAHELWVCVIDSIRETCAELKKRAIHLQRQKAEIYNSLKQPSTDSDSSSTLICSKPSLGNLRKSWKKRKKKKAT